MKKIIFLLSVLIITEAVFANEPDSVYLFSYGTSKNGGRNGLHFAWSPDGKSWLSIGNEFGFVRSDYGRWGSEKRMVTPYLIAGADGLWHCVWSLNERELLFAHAASKDLVDWGRQSYPLVEKGANCLRPILHYDAAGRTYNIVYMDSANKYYEVSTTNFNYYTTAKEVPASRYHNSSTTINVQGSTVTGQIFKVSWPQADKLIKAFEARQYRNSLHAETTAQDSQRFAGLKPVETKIVVDPAKTKQISDLLVGVFFEDINYAADGGIYAELIQNRDFEYALSDKEGRDRNWNSKHSWTAKGDNISFTIDSIAPIHTNNSHYAVLETKVPGGALINTGFDGIVIKKGERYDLTLFAKQLQGKNGKLLVQLVSDKSDVLAQTTVSLGGSTWKNVKSVLTSSGNANNAFLKLQPVTTGTIALDMISLFPQKTFKGRKNGLRADLAQTVADIHPRFIRFPGGCVAHGDGLGNIYHWKNTIGPLEARKPQRNLWGYHQTAGLGYFEYFQFCEDIGAQPLPVVAAGVPCQNSGTSPRGGGQQCGIPMEQMDEYVQDVLDLIEWANGDVSTKWGKKRAEAGHPKPFNLKYIGVGNEDLITDIFEERFTMIYKAIKEKYPDITVIGTVGPFFEGTDYEEGWELASKLKLPVVDEHYYVSPGWMIHNQEYYDRYDRAKSKVYLGEYAAHLPGRPNNLETALAEALYLTSLERNGDVVLMTSYAPLLAKEGRTQWNPDLIYFNNSEVKPTVGYHVQKLYGQNSGTEYLPATITLSNNQEAARKRIAYSVVRDATTNDVIVKLVNLLPVAVKTEIDLNGIVPTNSTATKIILKGSSPADRNAVPVESTTAVAEKFGNELPPYSFTLIRIKTK